MTHPPCKVEMNITLSPLFSSYCNSPSSNQSVSLISTRIPGLTVGPLRNNSGRSFSKLSYNTFELELKQVMES